MNRPVVLAVALLAAACSGPASQSTNPATIQSTAVANGRATPDGPCDYVKMEQPQYHIMTDQRVGIWEYLRWRSSGVCQSLKTPATWTTTGGRLHVKNNQRSALFIASKPGTYTVTATVQYNNNTYTGQSTITVSNGNG